MQSVIIRLYAKVLFLVFAIICYLFGLLKKRDLLNGKKHLERLEVKSKEMRKKLIVCYI